ncbi:MAG: PrsW family intramembrane metalloprotease [Deltaproteobacteria bacterium]|nr:PrsW family intramembrane metalloprotease [Deltaproteobacteria bacterium]
MRDRRRVDPSIEHEPHLREGPFAADPSEARAAVSDPAARRSEQEVVDHGVWDEPALSAELAGAAPAVETYRGWLERAAARTTPGRSWLVTAGVALAAGAAAIPMAFLANTLATFDTISLAVLVAVLGPVVEEVSKVVVAWWVVERRPYLFRRGAQLVVCAAAGGLAFGVLENLWYLHVVIPEAVRSGAVHAEDVAGLARWRWGVCTTMHATASTLAGLGLARMWGRAMREKARPRAAAAMPFLVAAMVVHGVYNAGALAFEIGRHVF